MKFTNIVLSLAGVLLLAGCSTNEPKTPENNSHVEDKELVKKQLSNFKIDTTNPKTVALTFTNLYNTGKYFQANTLMCSPDTNNNLVLKMEDIYVETLNKKTEIPNQIKTMMAEDKNFAYLKKYNSYTDLSIEDKQHFLFSYVKVFAKLTFKEYLDHYRFIATTEEEIDENTKIFENVFRKQENEKMQKVEVFKGEKGWCVNSFE